MAKNNYKEYREVITNELLKYLNDSNFKKWGKTGLIAKEKIYEDSITLFIEDAYYRDENIIGAVFNYQIKRRFDKIEGLWEKYILDIGENVNTDVFKCPTLYYNHFLIEYPDNYWTKMFYIESAQYKDIYQFTEEFIKIFSDKIIPIMNQTQSYKQLDVSINREEMTSTKLCFYHRGFLLKKMIVAKLAGNPNYEKVCQEVLELIEKKRETEPKNYEGFKYVYGEILKKLESVEEYVE